MNHEIYTLIKNAVDACAIATTEVDRAGRKDLAEKLCPAWDVTLSVLLDVGCEELDAVQKELKAELANGGAKGIPEETINDFLSVRKQVKREAKRVKKSFKKSGKKGGAK